MSIDVIVPESARFAYENFHFAQGVKADGLIIFSGQIGTNQDRTIPESAEDEFRNAWKAVGEALKAAGLDYDNIVEYTSYHVGLQANIGAFMKTRDEVLAEPWPAWTAIGIVELAVPGARCEIRVIAQKK